jgi:hypothetical protein
MKNTLKTIGIITFTVIIAFTMTLTTCSNGTTGGGNKLPPNNTPDLTGTITITPHADGLFIGKELSAVYNGAEAVSYQWKKGAANVGTDSNKYTPTEVGKHTVTVSVAGYNSKTSAAITVTSEPPKVSDFYGTWKRANGGTRIISSDELRFYNSDTDDFTFSLITATPVTNDIPETKTDYPYGFKFECKVKEGTEPRLTALGGIGADFNYVMFMHTNKKSYSGLGESDNIYFKQ